MFVYSPSKKIKFLCIEEPFSAESIFLYQPCVPCSPRSHGKYVNKGNHFGGSKAPRAPISVGEEYIVTIEEIGKEGSGVAILRGVSISVNNTNPGDKVKVRITKLGRTYATAEVFD